MNISELNTKKIDNVILDIDNTIICSLTSKEHAKYLKTTKNPLESFDIGDYVVFLRPYLREFIKFLFKNKLRVSIWTAGNKEYAIEIIKNIFPKGSLDFVLFSDHCDASSNTTDILKCLKMLYGIDGYRQDNTVLIDDRKDTWAKQKSNVIRAKYFDVLSESCKGDKFLLDTINDLKKYLPAQKA